MNPEQIKENLLLYRPGTEDENDPDMARAWQAAERDPALMEWFQRHQAFHAMVRRQLRQIQPPAGLKRRILAGRPAGQKAGWWRRREFLAAAASLVLLGSLLFWWVMPQPENQLATYRQRMVKYALTQYRMDIATNDMAQIRAFLAARGGAGDYVLSPALEKLPGAGCALLKWQNQPVSLVCFRLGKDDLIWLFVAPRGSIAGAPATAQPVLAAAGRMHTAAWSQQDKTYLLMGLGDESLIRRFL